MKLFRIGQNSKIEIIQEESYRNREVGGFGEVTLQEFITNYPELIPSAEIDNLNPPKFLVITSEASLSLGSMDILLIDDKGIPTVVETKLEDNRETRRAVLAQGLEYLAHLKSEWPAERFFEEATKFWAKRNIDLESVTEEKLGFGLDDDFLQKITSNINSNKMRLIIVSDKIPSELKRLMEFINDASNFDVFGMEVKFFASKEQDYKILVPHLVGFTETTKERKQRTPNVIQKIDEEAFFNEVSKLGPEAVSIMYP